MEPRQEDIAKLAYQFYLEDGKAEGNEAEHWARAEEFLRHPENYSDDNVLAPPSEPELTPALDERARALDQDSPSNPASGRDAVHQRLEIATDPRKEGPDATALQEALEMLPGIERVNLEEGSGRLQVEFDARRTNPAAIHDALLERGYQPSALPRA
jgi:hypothetical protein